MVRQKATLYVREEGVIRKESDRQQPKPSSRQNGKEMTPTENALATPFDLYIEVAGNGECLCHTPALPGMCFRAKSVQEVHNIAVKRIAAYARWLSSMHLAGLNPLAARLVELVSAGRVRDIRVAERERRDGAPVWISGNAAALFSVDHRALSDAEVRTHLRFVGQVIRQMRKLITPLSPAQRGWKPTHDRRSLNETFTHIGNCVWWYCSRIDDALPEPADKEGEDPFDRIERLFVAASEFLLAVPHNARTIVHVPTRYPTQDPSEPWTHTKVCRRQSEHMWAHLPGIESMLQRSSNPARPQRSEC